MLARVLRPFALSLLLIDSVAAITQMHGIQGSPYTATKKTTSVQKLADGTTITHSITSIEARDSQGRTVVQNVNDLGGHRITLYAVTDPSAGTSCNWSSVGKEATCFHFPIVTAPPRPSQPSASSNSGGAAFGLGSDMGAIIGGVPGGFVAAEVSGGAIPSADPNLRPTTQREKLPGKTVNGIYAVGVRFTTTYPVGSLGNDHPVVTVHENWTSPDLGITVLSIIDDPRTGTYTSEITNLDRAEPDPTLFQVPKGYTIKDQYPQSK